MVDERPVFDGINLVVEDMDAMVAFYEQLGVEVVPTDAEWAANHRNLGTPDGFDFDLDSLVFARQWNRGWPEGQTGAVIGFRVPSRDAVDELYRKLTTAGYAGQQEPYDAFWGARYAVVADPDGNSVGIMSPADPGFRSPEPPEASS